MNWYRQTFNMNAKKKASENNMENKAIRKKSQRKIEKKGPNNQANN